MRTVLYFILICGIISTLVVALAYHIVWLFILWLVVLILALLRAIWELAKILSEE